MSRTFYINTGTKSIYKKRRCQYSEQIYILCSILII
nr:MAG TPA: hypothetical protein [Caudoviricetes sp.]DAY71316.1 MAG TPA: hypothetical protein [Caudoviricetes sp.]